ncbi:unnamed protein product [Closterium sp. NIES-64]|nr:unnamed protein product [Closterium sp. NIES-64]
MHRAPTIDLSAVPPLAIPGASDAFPSPSAAAATTAHPSPIAQLARVSSMLSSPTPSPSGTPRNDSAAGGAGRPAEFRRLRRSSFSASASSTPSPRSTVSRPRMSAGDMLRLLSPTVATAANLGSCTVGGPYACPTCFLKFPSLHALGYHENARHGRGGGVYSGGVGSEETAGAGAGGGAGVAAGVGAMGILPARGWTLRRSSRYFQQPLASTYSEVFEEAVSNGERIAEGCVGGAGAGYSDRNVRARASGEGAANEVLGAGLAALQVHEGKAGGKEKRVGEGVGAAIKRSSFVEGGSGKQQGLCSGAAEWQRSRAEERVSICPSEAGGGADLHVDSGMGSV